MARDEAEGLLSVAQAATLLGVHPNTIRSWTDVGRLTAYRINARGDRRFRRSEVERLLVEDGATPATVDVAGPAVARDATLALVGRLARGFVIPTVQAVSRTVVEGLRADLGAQRAAVYVVEDDGLELVAHAGFREPPMRERDLHVPSTPDRGLVEIPVVGSRGSLGLLVTDAPANAHHDAILRLVAGLLAAGLQNARLLARTRREVQRARALRSVTKDLSSTLDLSAVLGEAVEMTRSLFEADRAGLWFVSDGTPRLRIAAQYGLSEQFLAHAARLTLDTDTIGIRAIREGRAHWIRDAIGNPGVGAMHDAYAAEGIETACLVPLVGREDTIGIIGLYHRRSRTWSPESLELVQAFADQAAVAIENARLYRSVADQAARMRSIQDLSSRLNRLTDVRSIAEAIVAEARTLADYHDIRIYRVDHEAGMCEPIAFTREMLEGDPADAEGLLRVEIGRGFTGWVAEHGEPLLVNDALADERGETIAGTDDVPESMLVVPMLYEGMARGVIVLSQLGFDRFSADDLQTMTIFAGYAAQAMANATTWERLKAQSTELARRADSQRRLLEINERLLSTLDQADVLETIADGLLDVVSYDNLSIYRTDAERSVMVPVLTRESHAELVSRYIIPFGRGLMGWAVEHGEPILANDALHDPRAVQVPGTPPEPEAVVVVPLVADGEALGALNVSRLGGEEVHFSESDFELIQLFAAQASIALRNADTHHEVTRLAETDALTGLGNHGLFQRDLGRMIEGVEAGHLARLALLMMDLDSFKAYNDRHGHPAGDTLLHQAATAIYGAARSDDRVYRYGGDEFAIILPGASSTEAARVAERIRHAVAALTEGDPTPVTITLGVSALPRDATDRAGLIQAADTALFYGKRAGEDRVVRADRLPPDVGQLRGTLEELASAALREGEEDPHAVEHLVERASQLAGAPHEDAGSLRDALLTISRALDARGTAHRGHADRVGRLARGIARALGKNDDEQRSIELAARLHALDDRGLGELGAIPSLRDVAALVAGYRGILADGARRGRRAARPRGRIGAHILGVANAYDELVSGIGGPRHGRNEALERVAADPATFRPDVLEALASAVVQRRDPGRRRRQTDVRREDRGAA
jgi:diguanylate cyclase (GGDEF)-like protein/excisionase family DNA binding protein